MFLNVAHSGRNKRHKTSPWLIEMTLSDLYVSLSQLCRDMRVVTFGLQFHNVNEIFKRIIN